MNNIIDKQKTRLIICGISVVLLTLPISNAATRFVSPTATYSMTHNQFSKCISNVTRVSIFLIPRYPVDESCECNQGWKAHWPHVTPIFRFCPENSWMPAQPKFLAISRYVDAIWNIRDKCKCTFNLKNQEDVQMCRKVYSSKFPSSLWLLLGRSRIAR